MAANSFRLRTFGGLHLERSDGGLVPVASADPAAGGLPLGVPGCSLRVARLSRGSVLEAVDSSAGGLVHVFVASGAVEPVEPVEGGRSGGSAELGEGDSVRGSSSGSAGLRLRAVSAAEVLVWTLPGSRSGA